MPDIDIQITDNSGEILRERTAWNAKDLTGQKFGRLTVIKKAENIRTAKGKIITRWICKCECGKETTVRAGQLVIGKTQSCGCLRYERLKETNTKHKMSKTKLYQKWSHMMQRCENPNVERYSHYGGRGIKVCDEWHNFKNFKEWAKSSGYSENLTLDRINVDGNYCPDNCRWVSWNVQANNTTRNHYITYNGETHSLSEWSKILNISYTVLRARINRSKWDIEKAFTTPVKKVI